jgi:exopolysaccharide biosynthesis polyprenyl glycosylphosphotransferase
MYIKRIILLFGDLLAFQIALAVSLLARYGMIESHAWRLHAIPFFIVSLLWVVGLFVTGMYDLSQAKNGLGHFRLFLEGMFVNVLIAVAFFYLVPIFGIEPRTNLLLFFVFSLLIVYGWRLVFNKFFARELMKTRLLFVGHTEDAMTLREMLCQSGLGFELTAVIHTTPRTERMSDGIRWIDRFDNLISLIREERISTIVLGHGIDEIPELRDALYQTLSTSVALIDRREMEETLTGRVPITNVTKSWFLAHLRESEKTWFETIKRILDVCMAIPFAALTIIVTPFVALFMGLTSEGKLFFVQERIGRYGKPFKMVKFRTMHHPNGQKSAEAEGAQFAVKNDPRITTVGRFLRATRIDELPQIWNVLRGDMSLVGPRPERPEFVEQLTARMPYYPLRHLTRPGLTGWAQIRYKYASNLDDNLVKLQYDLYYVKHRSLMLDAVILLRTIDTVLRTKGM